MEPGRNIEKLLRAYAKKRRAEPGASPELHSATRRLLQGEVARRPLKPEREGFFFLRFLGNCRPGLAAVLGVVVVCVLGVTLTLPTLNQAKGRASSVAALSNLRQIGIAAHLFADDNTNRLPMTLAQMNHYLGSTNVLIDPVSRKEFVYVGAGRNRDELPPEAPLAYSPEDRKGRAVLFANGLVLRLNSREFAKLTDENALQIAAMKEEADKKPADQRRAEASLMGSAQPAPAATVMPALVMNSQSFVRVDSGQTHSPGSAVPAELPEPVPVLSSFQVRQNGRDIEIVDRDGSVYMGYLQPVTATGEPDAKPAAEVAGPLPEAEPGGNLGYSFSVSGTNRSLQQRLVFTGYLTPATNDTGLASPLRFVRFSGTTLMDGTNQIRIHAVPAAR
jgi:hypothetical protein